jgi:hypothetical protein
MLFQSQINQYKAYTDRYIAFNAEYRKMVPYVKPQISFGVNFEQAAAAIRKFGEAASKLNNSLKKNNDKEYFRARLKLVLSPFDFIGCEDYIELVEPHHYDRFITMLTLGYDYHNSYIALETCFDIEKNSHLDTKEVMTLLTKFWCLHSFLNNN